MRPLLATAALLLASGCFRSIALNSAADAVSGSGGAYGRDDDPELIRAAVPFGLKTMEGLALELPEHVGLRLALARGFTQYAYAFVQTDADELGESAPQRKALDERASKLYRRARDYGLEGLKIRHGLSPDQLRGAERAAALAKAEKEDVPLLYWTLASWGSLISLHKNDMKLVGDLGAVTGLYERAVQLDETYDKGALHELALTLRSSAPPAEQDKHFQEALRLSQGKRLSLFVSHAENVLVPKGDKAAFVKELTEVKDSDLDKLDAPDDRLANLLAQRRARRLLDRVSDLFVD